MNQGKYIFAQLTDFLPRRTFDQIVKNHEGNEKRSYKIFEEFAYVLIEEARKSCYKNDFEVEVDGNVYALDSTTIDLCLSVFWWAEFRKHKGGIKLHTLYDIKTSIPSFLHVSKASVHDVNILDLIPYEVGSYYVMDKDYDTL